MATEGADDKPAKPKAVDSQPTEKPPEKKAEDQPKSEPFDGPAEKPADIEQTQILTKAELDKLSESDKERKPIKFVPPAKATFAESSEKSEPAEKPQADTKPEPPPPPLKAATWKVAPVDESWAPDAVASEFPELDRNNYQDHEYVERIVSDDWRIIGGSRRGRKQAHDSRFREDAMAFGHNQTATVLVVADGAGSSKFSRIGSHVAVNEVVDAGLAAVRAISDDDKKEAGKLEQALSKALTETVRKARAKAVGVAEKSKLSPKEFRATLLTIIHYHAAGKELLLSNQVGDGAISLLMKDKTVKKFGDSDSGAFSGEVSCFLTDSDAEKKAENIQIINNVDEVEAMFLCSDGIEDPFYPIDKRALDIFKQWSNGVVEPLAGFKAQAEQPPVFDQEAAAWGLAQWLEFEKRGENDDRTIMVMHRHPSALKF